MINYSKLCASLQENLMSEFYVNWAKAKFEGCIKLFMLPWKLRKRQILPVNQHFSSVYFSIAKFQLLSCNLSLAMIWQMTHTHKLPKLCSATFKHPGETFVGHKLVFCHLISSLPLPRFEIICDLKSKLYLTFTFFACDTHSNEPLTKQGFLQ